MCAIIDANIVAEAFGAKTTDAGKAFRQRVDEGWLQLVVGGKVLDELDANGAFRDWRATAVRYGKVRVANEDAVRARTQELVDSGVCVSDDEHVVALAQVSGARLVYSNDRLLHRDFKSKTLIDEPRGKVYTTRSTKSFTKLHQQMLGDLNLCTAKP